MLAAPQNIRTKVSGLAILNIITTKHHSRAWLSLILHCMKLVLLSHVNIAFLITVFNNHILFHMVFV